mgnify:FL=1
MQTVWGPLFRRARLGARRERIETRDGDFVDLDWVEPSGSRKTTGAAGAPLLLVLHGLEGSSQSSYAVGLMRGAAARSWRAVTLNFRSCSGELNRRPQFYHSGHTDDLDDVIGRVLGREPETRLVAVGVSLGGNVLLKWLGEQEVSAPKQLAGVVAISVPFDLAPCARALDTGLRRHLYAANFLATMREKVRQKAQRDPGFARQVDLPSALKARTFAEYDRAVTAPLNGFADERDYWVRASSGPYLPRIRRPTLLINALDDPIVPPESLPDPRSLPLWIRAEFVERGGHAGFIEGPWPWRVGSWAERRALEFLDAVLADAGPAC